jgi:hypothetical protein
MEHMPNSREEIAHMLDGTIDWDWGENANTTDAIDYVYNNCTDQADYDYHLDKFSWAVQASDEAGLTSYGFWYWEEFWGHYVMSQYLLSLNDDPSEYDLLPKAIEAAKKRMSDVVLYSWFANCIRQSRKVAIRRHLLSQKE